MLPTCSTLWYATCWDGALFPRAIGIENFRAAVTARALHGEHRYDGGPPLPGLVACYRHFMRQSKRGYASTLRASLAAALIDTAMLPFIGKPVSRTEAAHRRAAITQNPPLLLGAMALMFIVRRSGSS